MENLEQFLIQYKEFAYIAIFILTFFEGETVLLIAGYMSQQGILDLNLSILAAFSGTFFGDQLYFHIGRHWGGKMIQRSSEKWRRRSERVMALLKRYDTWFILGFRFVYGVRNVTPFALGSSGIAPWRFFTLNLIAAVVWALSFGFAGFFFGHAVELFLGEVKSYQYYVLGGIAAAAVLLWLYRLIRNGNGAGGGTSDGGAVPVEIPVRDRE
ncbi:MAG: DedA family protein [Magnetococcales bacterium]|nr:DedA family protein [Magnetococcales bacterium]